MTEISRYRAHWKGWQGGPGISTFISFATSPQAFADGVHSLLKDGLGDGAGGGLPGGITITFDPFIEILEDTTGQLINSLPVVPGSDMVGFPLAPFSAAAGACITWNTPGIVAGRRVRGRTFLVPMQPSSFQDDGTLSEAQRTKIQTAATAYADGTWDAAIWHRPVPGGAGGQAFAIDTGVVRDKTAVLTSRRD